MSDQPPIKMQKTQPSLKLHYFNIPGKAEPIRLACAYSGLKLDDVRLTFPEFSAKKESGFFKLGQVPCLEVDGKHQLVQSAAILRFIGKLGGLYPTDDLEAALVDTLLDAEQDMFSSLHVMRYSARFGFADILQDKDQPDDIKAVNAENRKKVFGKLNSDFYPRHLTNLEAIVQQGGTGWCAGTTSPTIADFVLAIRLPWLIGDENPDIDSTLLDSYPNLKALGQKLQDLPAVKAYYAK
eukprot:m.31733 g.31733  ORF g.31733 m.31733 type:complete len:239 (+) comp16504_c0_seq1:78-794(+)